MNEGLSDLQRSLAEALRHPRSLDRDHDLTQLARRHICGNDRLSPVQQLEIYREQFWLRHTGSLLEDFPGVSGILGQQDWQRLAEQYLREVVPDSYTLRDLGRRLPEVIAGADWLPHQALCGDMARLELAYIEVFDALESAPLAAERLACISEADLPRARLRVAPSVRLLEVGYPVADLRRALQAAGDAAVPIPEPARGWLVVYRHDLRLWDVPLSPVAHALLGGLARGEPLALAAEAAATSPDAEAELAAEIGSWFREWTTKGWLTDVELA